MEPRDYIQIATILAMVAGFTVVGVMDKDPTHYCEDRQIKAYCYDLSSTNKTCYTMPAKTSGKRCTTGWQKIPLYSGLSPSILGVYQGQKIICFTNGTCEVK